MKNLRCYSELIKLKTFDERFQYLWLNGNIGSITFGWDRYLNQVFYKDDSWREVRDYVIERDNACDLGIEGRQMSESSIIRVHHMNPIDVYDIANRKKDILDPEFLITTHDMTHKQIHYGSLEKIKSMMELPDRAPNDTCPWKRGD